MTKYTFAEQVAAYYHAAGEVAVQTCDVLVAMDELRTTRRLYVLEPSAPVKFDPYVDAAIAERVKREHERTEAKVWDFYSSSVA